MSQKHVVLIFGGTSSEHDISLLSASNISAAINRDEYSVSLIYISKDGQWYLVDDVSVATDSSMPISVEVGSGTFVAGSDTIRPDIVFPILHGKYGEDGTIQGLFEMMNMPYVGCGVLASALCMDKRRTKLLAENIDGVSASRWHYFDNSATFRQELEELIDGDISKRRAGPWFVKPSRAGSSVGVSKVEGVDQFEAAIVAAFEHDDAVLIEEGVVGREIEVAILGTPPNHRASRLGEVIIGDTFYDYDEKYLKASTASTSVNVNDLPEQLQQKIKNQALKIYGALGCEGLARVDFFLADNEEVYFNEVNTMPGFTNISMYPKLWQEDGLEYGALISALISDALLRTR